MIWVLFLRSEPRKNERERESRSREKTREARDGESDGWARGKWGAVSARQGAPEPCRDAREPACPQRRTAGASEFFSGPGAQRRELSWNTSEAVPKENLILASSIETSSNPVGIA